MDGTASHPRITSEPVGRRWSESEAHFECHNVLVSSLCQLGSNIVPHNINKDTVIVYIYTPVELYLLRKKRKAQKKSLVGERNYRAENYVEKGSMGASHFQRMLRLVKNTTLFRSVLALFPFNLLSPQPTTSTLTQEFVLDLFTFDAKVVRLCGADRYST